MDEELFDEVFDEILEQRLDKNVSLDYISHGILIIEDDEEDDFEGLQQIHISHDLLPTFMFFEEPPTEESKTQLDRIVSQIYGKMCFLDLQVDMRKLRTDAKIEANRLYDILTQRNT